MGYMKKAILILTVCEIAIFSAGCKVSLKGKEDIPVGAETATVPEEDKAAAKWLNESLTDSEEFADMEDYRYYARALNLDKDFFLSPDLWEVFYSEEINRNRDIDGKCIYLIRLNPYKLLDVYAKNNGCTADEICSKLSVSKAQIYYNWGYSPVWRSYESEHKDNKAAYSKEETDIFGIANGEDRSVVMRTHCLTVDLDGYSCEYKSKLPDSLEIRRRDLLSAFTDDRKTYVYSGYSHEERSAAFKVNGIGIRCVIPLTVPNAYGKCEGADTGITPFINVSPYAYGCTDEDKLDLMYILETE